jgi:hypothetical protein
MEDLIMDSGLKSVVLVTALMTIVVGLTACAKYPVVADTRSSSASPATSAPAR